MRHRQGVARESRPLSGRTPETARHRRLRAPARSYRVAITEWACDGGNTCRRLGFGDRVGYVGGAFMTLSTGDLDLWEAWLAEA